MKKNLPANGTWKAINGPPRKPRWPCCRLRLWELLLLRFLENQPAPVTEDLTQAQQAAAKLDSDNWAPKPAAPNPTDAELGLTNTQGSSNRSTTRRQSGKSYDDMVPLSDSVRQGGQVNQGSESWSPNTQP